MSALRALNAANEAAEYYASCGIQTGNAAIDEAVGPLNLGALVLVSGPFIERTDVIDFLTGAAMRSPKGTVATISISRREDEIVQSVTAWASEISRERLVDIRPSSPEAATIERLEALNVWTSSEFMHWRNWADRKRPLGFLALDALDVPVDAPGWFADGDQVDFRIAWLRQHARQFQALVVGGVAGGIEYSAWRTTASRNDIWIDLSPTCDTTLTFQARIYRGFGSFVELEIQRTSSKLWVSTD